jgi:hypothetical protein
MTSSMLHVTFKLIAVLRNITPDTTRARVRASESLTRWSRRSTAATASSVHDGQNRLQHVRDRLGRRSPPFERCGVFGVLHQEKEFALGLGVEEQRPGADVRLVGDLLGRDLVDAVLGEQFAGRAGDALELGLLVALAPSDRLGAYGHRGSSGMSC